MGSLVVSRSSGCSPPHKDRLGPAVEWVVGPRDLLQRAGQYQAWQLLGERGDRGGQLHPRNGRADTSMRAVAELHVRVRRPGGVEPVWIAEYSRIPVRRFEADDHHVAGCDV